jgi:hypothetical protein
MEVFGNWDAKMFCSWLPHALEEGDWFHVRALSLQQTRISRRFQLQRLTKVEQPGLL